MNSSLETQVRRLLANFVDVEPDDFRMDADLDAVYDMDSTELTALAMEIETRFGVKANRSDRDDWSTGQQVCRFVLAQTALAANAVAESALT